MKKYMIFFTFGILGKFEQVGEGKTKADAIRRFKKENLTATCVSAIPL